MIIPLSTGQKLNAETLHNLFTEAGIHSPDWEEIGNQLGLQLKRRISAADFYSEWSAHDPKASWVKLAEALDKIKDYKHAARDVKEKQGVFVGLTSKNPNVMTLHNLHFHVCKNVTVSPQSRHSIKSQ